MFTKKILFLLIAIVAIVVGAIYFFLPKTGSNSLLNKVPALSGALSSKNVSVMPSIPSAQKSPAFSVTRAETGEQGTKLYTLQARLLSDPEYKGNNLTLSIAIDGDTLETPVLLMLTAKDGQMTFAEQKDGKLIWKATPTTTIETAFKKGDRVEARFVIGENDKETQSVNILELDSMVQGNPLTEKILLAPTMIGKL